MSVEPITFTMPLGDSHASATARHAIAHALNGADPRLVDNAVLLTSEVVTNALRHTPGQCYLSMHFDPGTRYLRVEVCDSSTDLPAIKPDTAGPAGGGLRLVEAIATEWGAALLRGGKKVWFEFGEPGPQQA